MSEWKQYKIVQQAEFHRTGWLGVWDALVSAMTGKPRYSIASPVTVSFYAKSNTEVRFDAVQLEYKEQI